MTTRVFLTGGAGFLGRAIMRRARRESWDWQITCYSRDETKQDECRQRFPEARYLLGDVRDRDRLEAAMLGHDVVIHAAAMKYIPEAEMNPAECFSVNVDGARSVIRAAVMAGVTRVVGLSTDKACRPINSYGASKLMLERLFAEAAKRSGTTFTTVRYGNVVGSTGSVIPLFQRQLAELGRVRLTDPHMTRFWMSPDEAIDTVLFALEPQRVPGSVTVPRPQAMSMGTLAKTLAGEAVEIIGVRPGEKEHEELIHWQESTRVLNHAGRFYELLPVAGAVNGGEPFTMSSHSPFGGFVTPERMLAMIEDATHV